MSLSDDRMKKQSQENKDIYYAWLAECKRTGEPNPNSMRNYESAITLFFEKYLNDSILDVEIETIDNFVRPSNQTIKVSTKSGRLHFLTNFLAFIERNRNKYKPRWKWNGEVLDVIAKELKDEEQSVNRAKPLTAREMIQLYEFFKSHIYEQKWLESYTIFRLMYNLKLNKYEIAKINGDTFDKTTGELHLESSSKPIKLDEGLLEIFQSHGPDFLPSNVSDVYSRLTDLEQVLSHGDEIRNITQTVLNETREHFKIRCPECGNLIENDLNHFGFVKVDIFNLGKIILCKTCLENIREDIH